MDKKAQAKVIVVVTEINHNKEPFLAIPIMKNLPSHPFPLFFPKLAEDGGEKINGFIRRYFGGRLGRSNSPGQRGQTWKIIILMPIAGSCLISSNFRNVWLIYKQCKLDNFCLRSQSLHGHCCLQPILFFHQ